MAGPGKLDVPQLRIEPAVLRFTRATPNPLPAPRGGRAQGGRALSPAASESGGDGHRGHTDSLAGPPEGEGKASGSDPLADPQAATAPHSTRLPPPPPGRARS